jgi:hypothetical protein
MIVVLPADGVSGEEFSIMLCLMSLINILTLNLIGMFLCKAFLPILYVLCIGNVETGKKVYVIPRGKKGDGEQSVGHVGHILCLCISADGQYLVS